MASSTTRRDRSKIDFLCVRRTHLQTSTDFPTMNNLPAQAPHEAASSEAPRQWSWAARQSLAILAVDNLAVDDEGLRLLEAVDQGRMTHDEAIAIVLQQAASTGNQQR